MALFIYIGSSKKGPIIFCAYGINYFMHKVDRTGCKLPNCKDSDIINLLIVRLYRFTASAFRKLPSVYVFCYFPFGFEGRMWDLIVSVLDHCLSFYFSCESNVIKLNCYY